MIRLSTHLFTHVPEHRALVGDQRDLGPGPFFGFLLRSHVTGREFPFVFEREVRDSSGSLVSTRHRPDPSVVGPGGIPEGYCAEVLA